MQWLIVPVLTLLCVLKRFPEVVTVVSRSGSPELATDVMGIELGDVFAILKPRSEWTTPDSKGELVEKMEHALQETVPGVGFSFTQPIEMRFNELIAGVRSDVVVDALRHVHGCPGMSVSEVRGFGCARGHPPREGEITEVEPFEKKVRIEVFCLEADVPGIVEAIRAAAHTGHPATERSSSARSPRRRESEPVSRGTRRSDPDPRSDARGGTHRGDRHGMPGLV